MSVRDYAVQFSKGGIIVEGEGPYAVRDGIHAPRKFTILQEALAYAEKQAMFRRKEHNDMMKKARVWKRRRHPWDFK